MKRPSLTMGGKTKIVRFLGGLGNQMFQYAFLLSLKQHFAKVKADLTGFETYELHQGFELKKVFDIDLEPASSLELRVYSSESRDWLTRKLRRIYGTKHAEYHERQEFSYDPTVYEDPSPRWFWGYWQHHAYIQMQEGNLRRAFQFKEALDGKNQSLVQTMALNNTVSVHVRRGDYLGHSILGGICDFNYYQQAIACLKEKIESPLFVFFSNDMEWCRANFSMKNALYVDWNKGNNSYKDMQMMSCCKHHIIANSSFSWWGAWLNPSRDKIVVSPKKWINDSKAETSALILPDWVKI